MIEAMWMDGRMDSRLNQKLFLSTKQREFVYRYLIFPVRFVWRNLSKPCSIPRLRTVVTCWILKNLTQTFIWISYQSEFGLYVSEVADPKSHSLILVEDLSTRRFSSLRSRCMRGGLLWCKACTASTTCTKILKRKDSEFLIAVLKEKLMCRKIPL